MFKAAVVLDDWKLPAFKKTLDKKGYKYSEHEGPFPGCITLQVETDDIARLSWVVKMIQNKLRH